MNDLELMRIAISEARQGQAEGGIPIGSALARTSSLIGRGHNRRVQEASPILHAEIDCLRAVGRLGSFHDCVLYSTLMPCYLCAGAVIQFGIRRVVVGENETFQGAEQLMREHDVDVCVLDLRECKSLMQEFIKARPELWNEDIGA